MQPDRYCSATIYGPRVHSWGCQRAGVVERHGKWYCRQHDPEAVKARMLAREAKRKSELSEDDRVEAEGQKLARKLGIRGNCFTNRRSMRTMPYLVVSFTSLKKLVQRIKK